MGNSKKNEKISRPIQYDQAAALGPFRKLYQFSETHFSRKIYREHEIFYHYSFISSIKYNLEGEPHWDFISCSKENRIKEELTARKRNTKNFEGVAFEVFYGLARLL